MRSCAPLLITLCMLLPFAVFAQATDKRKEQLDVLHYNFNITLSDDNDTIAGIATLTIKFLQPTTGFDLDLVKQKEDGKGMTVTSIITGGRAVVFLQEGETLHLVTEVKTGDVASYVIRYKGIPADGLIIARNKYNHRTFFADNWPNRAHNWLPCVDHPSDKASVEFIVKAPDHYQVVSNGVLVEETNLPDHSKLTHWQETVPLPTKIMVIGVADFAVNYPGDVDCIPLSTWVYPENKEYGFSDYAVAKDILPFYIKNIGPYPYRKLANVQSKTIFGGMENAGAIFYSENSVKEYIQPVALMAHEIAHQWFGDYITEANWQHIWLSEGFATYMANLYIEKTYGLDSLLSRLREDRQQVIAFSSKNHQPVVDTSITSNFMQLLNANSYQKGGWVLHMLRRKLGDVLFWKGIRAWYTRYGGGNATTDDFRRVMEATSGQNLRSFFEQWLYTPGQPSLQVTWQYDVAKKLISLELEQTQSTVFAFPLQLCIHTGDVNSIKSFNIEGRHSSLSIPAATRPDRIELDPYVNLLFKGEIKEISH
ncbi:MAG TPA: M1 family metallopeptidase [Chitinophagaceae bacterium]